MMRIARAYSKAGYIGSNLQSRDCRTLVVDTGLIRKAASSTCQDVVQNARPFLRIGNMTGHVLLVSRMKLCISVHLKLICTCRSEIAELSVQGFWEVSASDGQWTARRCRDPAGCETMRLKASLLITGERLSVLIDGSGAYCNDAPVLVKVLPWRD